MGMRLVRSSDKPSVDKSTAVARAHELVARARQACHDATHTCARARQVMALPREFRRDRESPDQDDQR
jgi:hypothetical protein